MARTSIKITAHNEVTLKAVDRDTGEQISRVFWIGGRYVREGLDHSGSDPQVCEGLSHRGYTLEAANADELLSVIRREWAAYRRHNA